MGDRITVVERAGMKLDVRDEGPIDGDVILLLHGFPQDSRSWEAVAPLLHAAGYRTLAPDQRGYSSRARPSRRGDYRAAFLVDDVVAVIEAVQGGPVHVVGHDWGAIVAWGLAARHPDRVRTVTAVSVPHPAAFLRAFVTSPQLLRSWYIFAFQLPWIPEMLLSRKTFARTVLRRTGQPAEATERDTTRLADPAAVKGGVNWYRALPWSDPRSDLGRVTVPTLMVWSDGDFAVDRAGVESTHRYVSGPYRAETLVGIGHWIPDEAPAELAYLVLEHIDAHI